MFHGSSFLFEKLMKTSFYSQKRGKIRRQLSYILIFNNFDYIPAIIEAHMGSLLYTMWQIKSHLTMSNSGFKKLIGMPAKQ